MECASLYKDIGVINGFISSVLEYGGDSHCLLVGILLYLLKLNESHFF